jgi:AcrR family transcriptional regulator
MPEHDHSLELAEHAGSVPVRHERRDAALHRQRILAAARDLFAARGVAGVSMRQIAQAAQVGQGTLYRRYPSKGDLCKELAHERHVRFATELRAWLAAATDLPALARLDGVMRRMLDFVVASAELLQVIAEYEFHTMDCDLALDPAQAPPGQDQWFDWLHALVTDLLTEAAARAEIAPLDAPYIADMLLLALNPMFVQFQQVGRGYSTERILAGVRRIFITGVRGG